MLQQVNSQMKVLVAVALAASVQLSAHAEEQTSPAAESATTAEAIAPKNQVEKKEGESDVDQVITNRKLRAETGAKSKYSFSAALSYSGGTVNSPGADTRPNIATGTAVPAVPALGGSLGAKYRLSQLQTLALDVGIVSRKPFHSDKNKNLRERTTVSNPSLTYQTVYKTGEVQNVSSFSGTVVTDNFFRELGYQYGADFGQTAIYDFGGSKFSMGLSFTAGYNTFDKDDAALRADQTDYSFGFFPFAEYVFSDRLNFRTVFRPFSFEHIRSEPFGNVIRNVYTQSMGIGISVTRDVFLYPNVQFVPQDLRSELTNVGLSANINI